MLYLIKGVVFNVTTHREKLKEVSVVSKISDATLGNGFFMIGGLLLADLKIKSIESGTLIDDSYKAIEDYAVNGLVEIIKDLRLLPRAVFDPSIVNRYSARVLEVVNMLKVSTDMPERPQCITTYGLCCHRFVSVALTEAKQMIGKLRDECNDK